MGEVGIESDLLDLGLLGLGLSVLNIRLRLLSLSNSLASLLVLQLGIAVGGTPRLGSLLLRAAVTIIRILTWKTHCHQGQGKRTGQCS